MKFQCCTDGHCHGTCYLKHALVRSLIRLEPGDCDFWMLSDVPQQTRPHPIEIHFSVLVRISPLFRQVGYLFDSGSTVGVAL